MLATEGSIVGCTLACPQCSPNQIIGRGRWLFTPQGPAPITVSYTASRTMSGECYSQSCPPELPPLKSQQTSGHRLDEHRGAG